MRFKRQMMDAIRLDLKTVTRRLVVPGKPCLYKVGRVYMATDRPRFKRTSDEYLPIPIRIVVVEKTRVSYINEPDAEREGFVAYRGETLLTARDQFLIAWGSIHGWPAEDPEVWRIKFEKAEVSKATVEIRLDRRD